MAESQESSVVIRRATVTEHASCLAIARSLPTYFLPDGIAQMGRDLELHETWVAARQETTVGFAVLERKSAAVMEILWLAVRPASRSPYSNHREQSMAMAVEWDGTQMRSRVP